MPYLKCHDLNMYYRVDGTGFPVLFISGLSGGSWSWSAQIPFFAKKYRCIAFDNRGAGRTEAPPGPYSMEQMAVDTVRLLHGLEVEKTFVLGLSMGGMIAQELATLLPHRIKGLVLGCTHPGGQMQVRAKEEVYRRLVSNDGLSPKEVVEKNIPLLFRRSTQKSRPEVLDDYRKQQSEAPVQPEHAFQAQYRAILDFDFSHRLSKVGVPTLVITGSEDILVPPENSRIMAQKIPVSTLRELPETGHALHVEQPEVFNRELDAFFSEALTLILA
ncbi:MAG: alpha/beta hydrolase [Desulfohalobiaceae bacterium]|nr:alpha/beta hydrolase [Desulfohalobiaceae bacterium]